MKKTISISLFLYIMTALLANSNRDDLAVINIPDSLTKRANSVVRAYEVSLTIKSPNEAEYTSHRTVTVLNEKAEHELSLELYYNSFAKVKTMSAFVYDKNGKLMNKHSKTDMNDYATQDGFSLYQDSRVKHILVGGGVYPVTIDYTYTYEYKGVLDYPNWWIQRPHQSIENATLTVSVPGWMGINFKVYNISLTTGESKGKDNSTIYKWAVNGLKAISVPGNSYEANFYLPYIDLSPKKFEIAEYQGSFDSWKEFGTIMSNAYKAKRQLNDKAVRQIQGMVKGAKNDRQKAEILYTYLQQNFRYVSIQIGMGGYIPFSAGTVDSTKYGDCKALSNYMCALLNTVGIKSYPTLINAGPNLHPIDTTFPTNKFNHCILYAEIDHQPTWLECTSNSLPFGELGTFTENRFGLMLTDDGGKIINTPVSDASLNTETVIHYVTLTDNVHADISGSIELTGQFRPGAKSDVIQGTKKEQENYLYNYLYIKQYENLEFYPPTDTNALITINIKGQTSKVDDFSANGKRFLPSSYIKQWYQNLTLDSTRKHDLLLGFPNTKNEQLIYLLADSQSVSLPPDFNIDNALVSFNRKSVKESEKKITIKTVFIQKKHIISSGDIALLRESLQTINKHLQQKIILMKQ